MRLYDHETDEAAPVGVLIQADSLDEAEEQLQYMGLDPEEMVLAYSDDPELA